MHSRPPTVAPGQLLIDPHVLGTFCGLFSAFVYTCANAFLRSVTDCDAVWVSAVKAVPTVVAMAPVMAVMHFRGQRVLPPLPILLAIVGGGLLGQLGGNISFQWALGKIGVALTVPLSLGGMILGAAILGRVFLFEPVTPKVALALGLLLAAIAISFFAAQDAARSVARESLTPLQVLVAVAVACSSGMAYAALNVILRYCIMRGAPLPTILFAVSIGGLVSLSCISWLQIGPGGMLATTTRDLSLMLAAGVCNTIAFVSLTKSLQLTSVVYVNALNATQATLAAVAGVVIFREALSPWRADGRGVGVSPALIDLRAHRPMRLGQD